MRRPSRPLEQQVQGSRAGPTSCRAHLVPTGCSARSRRPRPPSLAPSAFTHPSHAASSIFLLSLGVAARLALCSNSCLAAGTERRAGRSGHSGCRKRRRAKGLKAAQRLRELRSTARDICVGERALQQAGVSCLRRPHVRGEHTSPRGVGVGPTRPGSRGRRQPSRTSAPQCHAIITADEIRVPLDTHCVFSRGLCA